MGKEQINKCCPPFKTMCGGQALIEGIMMRGPNKQAAVVRRPDGELEIRQEELMRICPTCGAGIQDGDMFCRECGGKL